MAHQISAWSGAEFVQRLSTPLTKAAADNDVAADADAGAEAHVKLTDDEVTEWLALFGPPRRKRKERRSRPLNAGEQRPRKKPGSTRE